MRLPKMREAALQGNSKQTPEIAPNAAHHAAVDHMQAQRRSAMPPIRSE